jgi:hypothetical protein
VGTQGVDPLPFRLLPWLAASAVVLACSLALPSGMAPSAPAGVARCADGLDNDGDGRVDYNPGDPADDFGCRSATDNSESPEPECADGSDNDSDGRIDGFDASCNKGGDFHGRHDDEANPAQCADDFDDDFDGLVDYPDDPGCASRADNTEDPDDADGDGLYDADDNCPDADNLGQADRDDDGRGNACDACPRLAASSLNGCPNVRRSLTLDYSRGAFRGRLSARKAPCRRDQYVTVWEKVGTVGGGDDVQLGEDYTNRKGRYVVSLPRSPGKYYARAEGDTISTAGNCRSVRSAVMRLN